MTVRGSCLCADVAWEVDGPLEFMHHCHCGRCRKLHGTPFTTDLMCRASDARLLRGAAQIARFGQVRLVLEIPEVDSTLDPSSRATCSARAVAPISVNSR